MTKNSNTKECNAGLNNGDLDALGVTTEQAPAAKRKIVSLLEMARPEMPQTLSLVRITEDQTAIVPMTADVEEVDLHYFEEPEVGGYALCNGDGCVACAVGKKVERRLLNLVYRPTLGDVAVLAFSPSMRPHAILPQYLPHLTSQALSVLFVQKTGFGKYRVTARPLPPGADSGHELVEGYLTHWEDGEISLASVYSQIDNETLLTIPAIACLAKLKGLGD
jgi:hypothetical protein